MSTSEAIIARHQFENLVQNKSQYLRPLLRQSLFAFVQYHWDVIVREEPIWNWHIPYLCKILQDTITRAAKGLPKKYDIIINIPPGETKSTLAVQMAPAWAWTNWAWLRFICGSYSGDLATEHGGLCKDIVESPRYSELYPNLAIRRDHDAKSNFKLKNWRDIRSGKIKGGGQRIACSVGGSVTGKHGHVIMVDDPLNPNQAISTRYCQAANHWYDHTLSTRKVNKEVTPTILIMQRLHEDDVTGHILEKEAEGKKVLHICLPGQNRDYEVKPAILANYYQNNLLDPQRMSWQVMDDLKLDLGEYGFAGQIGQDPAPPEGGLFKVGNITIVDTPPAKIQSVVRYWDKAGTEGGGAFTAGGQIARMENGGYLIMDMVRGQWGPDKREAHMRETAEADGTGVRGYIEQEPGSGGKDSALATIRNLEGYPYEADRPTGDKEYRADPLAAQVNAGNVWMMKAPWNKALLDEMRLFPFGKYMDQVDSLSGGFSKLAAKTRKARALRSGRDKRRG